jgi:uncharacterized membrane protein YgcG
MCLGGIDRKSLVRRLMRNSNSMRRVFILCALIFGFFLNTSFASSFVIVNDGTLSEKVTQKMNEMGNELFEKSGISVYMAVPKSLEGKSTVEYGKAISEKLKTPYVLFILAKNDTKVDILFSKGLGKSFDKEGTLSPFPWSGTVLPLLAQKKENDKYNAAALNGYADIVEQIASSKKIKLKSAIGNTNKNIYWVLQIFIYGFLIFIFVRYAYRRIKTR